MVLDSRIQKLKDYYGITDPQEWTDLTPENIIAIPDVGPATLDHLRIYLSARGLALKNDRTPEYWQKNLSAAKIGHQLGDEDHDAAIVTPFTIFIDSAEQYPFSFTGIRAGAEYQDRFWIPKIEWRSLGRYPDSLGDYSIDGGVGYCHVERKSREDLQSTILGFDGRRSRFERELEELSDIEFGCVVVECTFREAWRNVQARGKKDAQTLRRTIYGSLLAYEQDYKCRWFFSDSREEAQHITFKWLERYWKHHLKGRAKEVQEITNNL